MTDKTNVVSLVPKNDLSEWQKKIYEQAKEIVETMDPDNPDFMDTEQVAIVVVSRDPDKYPGTLFGTSTSVEELIGILQRCLWSLHQNN